MRGKEDRAKGKEKMWGFQETYSLMNWKRLIFNSYLLWSHAVGQ